MREIQNLCVLLLTPSNSTYLPHKKPPPNTGQGYQFIISLLSTPSTYPAARASHCASLLLSPGRSLDRLPYPDYLHRSLSSVLDCSDQSVSSYKYLQLLFSAEINHFLVMWIDNHLVLNLLQLKSHSFNLLFLLGIPAMSKLT